MVVLSGDREVFVWGRRMGVYPQVELTLDAVEKRGMIYNQAEINQAGPRLVKNNLIFHKINKIIAGHYNTALITDKGELLLQGMNDFGQLALHSDIKDLVGYFPEFMKIDALNDYIVKDVALGSSCVHVLCEHKLTGRGKLFAWGSNDNGQLGTHDTEMTTNEPFDMTYLFIEEKSIHNEDVIFDEDEILQVVSGGQHTMVLIKKGDSQKLYGIGKINKGQLAFRRKSKDDPSFTYRPLEITINHAANEEIKSISAGGMHSMAVVGPKIVQKFLSKKEKDLKT